MRIIRFSDSANTIKLVPESFDDLYLLAMVTSEGDSVESKSYRRFKASEGDVGEQKEVIIALTIEKVEIDKSADRLRFTGKIIGGKPEEFIRINSYHTLNIAPGDVLTIKKSEWKQYILRRLKQAVAESKKPKLAIIVLDDEKASVAYIRGSGIDIVMELYSKLSKKLKEKDFAKQLEQYFNEIIKAINEIKVDIVIVAGPGFMKDDIKMYIAEKGIGISKKLFYTSASDAERSGIREVMQSEIVSNVLENEHIKKEFDHLNLFMKAIGLGSGVNGIEKVSKAIDEGEVGLVMVNDSVLNDPRVKELLDKADMHGIRIEIFNADDDAGIQLKGFKEIAAISKSLMQSL